MRVFGALGRAAETAEEAIVGEGLTAIDWGRATAIVVVAVVVAQLAKRLIARNIEREESDRTGAQLAARLVSYVVIVGGFVYALGSLDVRLGPLLGALGIGGIALAFAMQDILQNFIAGILLQARRPFRRGEQIITNDYEGTVEDINLRTVVIRTVDGDRVHVPNASVLRAPIVNHSRRGSRRTTLTVGVAFDTDLERAKEVVLEAVRRADGVRDRPVPEAYVEEFGDSAVQLAIRFWHAPTIAEMWRVRDAVAISVKRALDDANITIPFPQSVVRFAPSDGEIYLREASDRPSR